MLEREGTRGIVVAWYRCRYESCGTVPRWHGGRCCTTSSCAAAAAWWWRTMRVGGTRVVGGRGSRVRVFVGGAQSMEGGWRVGGGAWGGLLVPSPAHLCGSSTRRAAGCPLAPLAAAADDDTCARRRLPAAAVNQALLCTALGLPPTFFRRFAQSNAAFTVLDFEGGGGEGGQRVAAAPRVRVERMNQVWLGRLGWAGAGLGPARCWHGEVLTLGGACWHLWGGLEVWARGASGAWQGRRLGSLLRWAATAPTTHHHTPRLTHWRSPPLGTTSNPSPLPPCLPPSLPPCPARSSPTDPSTPPSWASRSPTGLCWSAARPPPRQCRSAAAPAAGARGCHHAGGDVAWHAGAGQGAASGKAPTHHLPFQRRWPSYLACLPELP